jgi:hypothetical protein
MIVCYTLSQQITNIKKKLYDNQGTDIFSLVNSFKHYNFI